MFARADWGGSGFLRYGKQLQSHVILRLLAAFQNGVQASQKGNDMEGGGNR